MRKSFKLWPLSLGIVAMQQAHLACAQQGQRPVGADLSFDFRSQYDDNARKSGVDSDAIGERQDRVSVILGLNLSSEISTLVADYDYSEEYFSKQSQDTQKRLTGRLSAELAAPSKLASIRLEHDRKSLLTAANVSDIAENTDERETIALSAVLQGKPTASVQPILRGIFSRTNYLESKNNNYDLSGLDLELRRPVSKAFSYGIRGISSKTEFEFQEAFDYDYQVAAARFLYDLPRSTYDLEFGRNFQEPKFGEKTSDLFYSLDVSYRFSLSEFSVSASKSLADSSSANSATGQLGDTSIGSNLEELDFVESDIYRLRFSSQVCPACSIDIEASLNEIDYRDLIENTSKVLLVAAGFSYKISRTLDTVLRIENRDTQYQNDPASDLNATNIRLAVNKALTPKLQLGFELSSQVEGRENEDIDSNIATVLLSYTAI